MDNNVIVDGVVLPAPAQDGIEYALEAIWSDNAGRVANCDFVGDVRAVKGTLSLKWDTLTYSQVKLIRQAFTHLNKPFFNITFTNDEGKRTTLRCYSTMPKSTIHTYRDDKGNITGMTVDVVQK